MQALLLCVRIHGGQVFLNSHVLILLSLATTHYRLSDDIATKIHSQLCLFADDYTVYWHISGADYQIFKSDSDILSTWTRETENVV